MIRIAIVGTGGMAHGHAQTLSSIRGVRLVAGVDVHPERLEAYCDEHGIPERHPDVKRLLGHVDFDAAVVATPDAFHVPCALPLVNAGKHVLCEKPIAPTAKEARKLVRAAKKAGGIHMVNFSYRNAPALHKARHLVASGKLGRIMHFEAHYLQTWLSSPMWGDWKTSPNWLWRLSTAHGSQGALGDIGVHIVDLATFVADDAVASVNGKLKTFDKAPGNRVGEYELDANDSALLRVELASGGLGTINVTRWATGQPNSLALNLYGDRGALRLDLDRSTRELEVCLGRDVNTTTWKTLACPQTPDMHRRFLRSIRTGVNDPSDFERGWQVQRILDAAVLSNETSRTIPL